MHEKGQMLSCQEPEGLGRSTSSVSGAASEVGSFPQAPVVRLAGRSDPQSDNGRRSTLGQCSGLVVCRWECGGPEPRVISGLFATHFIERHSLSFSSNLCISLKETLKTPPAFLEITWEKIVKLALHTLQ